MNRGLLALPLILISAISPLDRCLAGSPLDAPLRANYARPFERPTRAAFLPLPPGAIEPAGWLRDWCITARDGYTGHMDEIDTEFRRAWAADHIMTGDQLSYWDKGAWPYEGGGYWFEGLVRLGYALHDEFLIQKAKRHLDVVVTNMNENSILFMWWLDRNNAEHVRAAAKNLGGEAREWPVWANGLMGRTLAAYYAASGDKQILRAMELAYSGDPSLVRKGWSLSNPLAAFETYTWTGNSAIKNALTELFARHKTEAPNRNVHLYDAGYNRFPDETLPWYRQSDHGVHFNESVTPWALGYLWTGNADFLNAAAKWYDIAERGDEGMQPHGVPVSDEDNGATGSFRGTETCTVAGYMASQVLLLRVGGNGRIADRVERAFFNAAPAVVSRDFKTHVYLQSPNRINRDLPGGGRFQYRKTHWPLCCTASLNRMLPCYVGHMWMATYDNGLAALHYGPCRVSALVADQVPLNLTCRTDYPFNESIEIALEPARQAVFPLSFRVPGWCKTPELRVNGSPAKLAPDARGFVRLEQLWKKGDIIQLRFPMAARVRVGHDNDVQDTPYATVTYGPLLFALGIPDTMDPNSPEATVPWNYALDISRETAPAEVTVERRALPGRWDWPLDSPLKLHVPARRFDWKAVARQSKPTGGRGSKAMTLLPTEPVVQGGPAEQIVLIPYGCTKFRISMFPIIARARPQESSGN